MLIPFWGDIIKFILHAQVIWSHQMKLTVPLPCSLLNTHFIAKLISLALLQCSSESLFVNRLLRIDSSMNVAYVWLAGWWPEQPCLQALSVLSSRCMLRPPVCLPGWPTLAPTICAILNTFCHCHTVHHVYWWSLSDSPSLSRFIFQTASLQCCIFRTEFCRKYRSLN